MYMYDFLLHNIFIGSFSEYRIKFLDNITKNISYRLLTTLPNIPYNLNMGYNSYNLNMRYNSYHVNIMYNPYHVSILFISCWCIIHE